MKYLNNILFFLSLIMPLSFVLVSKSIDATKNPAWINNQLELTGNDIVRGFVQLKDGFKISGEAATVLFDTYGIIDGSLYTRALDTIKLENDLMLGSQVRFVDSVMFDGRGHTVHISSNLEIPYNKSVTFLSDITLDGQGHTLTLASADSLIVGENAQLTLKNIHLHILCSDALCIKYDTSSLELDNATITLNADQSIKNGSVVINNDVIIRGPHEFQYKSDRSLTVNSCSMLYFDNNTIFRYEPLNGDRFLFHLTDASSVLYFNGCFLKIIADDVLYSGLQLTRGTLYFENKVVIENKSSDGMKVNQDPLKSFEWGNGKPGSDLDIKILAGARIEIEGHLFDNPSV